MLNNVKLLLGMDLTDERQDDKLELIIDMTTKRLKRMLGGLDVPPELDYIVINLSVSRFNKIGSEGLSSHDVEGESLTFSDSDFYEYKSDIENYLKEIGKEKKGVLRFL